MELGRKTAGVVVGVSMLAAGAPALAVGPISVPNHSFEQPVVPNISPFASPVLVDWQKNADPNYLFTSGVFLNVDTDADVDTDPDIDNLDGTQSAFLFSTPGAEVFQDLVATYQVGESYHLTIAIDGGGQGMAVNEPLLLRLFYRDPNDMDGDNRNVAGEITILNTHPLTNPLTPITHLNDVTLNLPVVQPGDPWAGKTIGIQFLAPQNAVSGYWDFDNVRLTSVPEPAMIGFAALAGLCLARWRRLN